MMMVIVYHFFVQIPAKAGRFMVLAPVLRQMISPSAHR
jgi:hypothetical protein